MVGTTMILANLLAAIQGAAPLTPASSTDCARVLSLGVSAAAAEVCDGETQLNIAQKTPRSDPERDRRLSNAADLYRRAVGRISDDEVRGHLLGKLADLYDAQHLNDATQMEMTLRELVTVLPTETGPLYRLAALQEQRQEIEAAERTLMSAKQLRPDDVEPYKHLAQFYARRVTALSTSAEQSRATQREPESPGSPDAAGVYRIGGALGPPTRDGVPLYPPQARAAGVQGAVVVEVIINELGAVTDARVVRSVPLLDEAALAAVRKWRFEPSVVNGRAVPVRMNLTVNFSP